MIYVRCFFTFSGSKIAKLARWSTNGPFGHTGLTFEDSDDNVLFGSSLQCFEGRSGEGFVGPFSMQDTEDYVNAHGGYFLVSKRLDLSESAVKNIYSKAINMVGDVSYSKAQLGKMFLAERYGIRLKRTPNAIVCSEAVARLLYPYVDLRDCDHKTFDVVSPNSAYWRMCEIQAGYDAGRVREVNNEKGE